MKTIQNKFSLFMGKLVGNGKSTETAYRSVFALSQVSRTESLTCWDFCWSKIWEAEANAQWKQRNTGHECICCESASVTSFFFSSLFDPHTFVSQAKQRCSALYCSLRCGHFSPICFLCFSVSHSSSKKASYCDSKSTWTDVFLIWKPLQEIRYF